MYEHIFIYTSRLLKNLVIQVDFTMLVFCLIKVYLVKRKK